VALHRIKVGRLYRAKFRTFEDYCHTVWGLSRVHFNRLLAAGKTVAALREAGAPVPTTESQAREIASLPKETKAKVMKKARKKAGKGRLTAKHVKAAKREVLGQPEEQPKTVAANTLTPLSVVLRQVQRAKALLGPEKEFDEVHALLEEIEAALAAHAKKEDAPK
jgi:hypothetical protein